MPPIFRIPPSTGITINLFSLILADRTNPQHGVGGPRIVHEVDEAQQRDVQVKQTRNIRHDSSDNAKGGERDRGGIEV